MAWFTKENLIANSPKAVIPMIAIQNIAIELLWPPPISVSITHASIPQSEANPVIIIATRSCTPKILNVSFLLIIVQKSLNHRSSFLAQPRISGTNIAVISRSARVAIRFIISSVVSGPIREVQFQCPLQILKESQQIQWIIRSKIGYLPFILFETFLVQVI